MLAVCPMLASAAGVDPTAATTTSEHFKGVAETTDINVASTSYVQGAYNAAIGAVNETYTLASGKQEQLKAGNTNISATVGTSVRADGTADNATIVTEKAVRDAIKDAGGQTETQVKTLIAGTNGIVNDNGTLTVNAGQGIEVDSDAVTVKLDGSTLSKSASGLKVGTITNDNITDGTISQGKIDGLTGALAGKQAQLTNGTANVNATVKTSIGTAGAGGTATDTNLVTEKAVADALANKADTTTYKVKDADGTTITLTNGVASVGSITAAKVSDFATEAGSAAVTKINAAGGAGISASNGKVAVATTDGGGLKLDGSGDAATLNVKVDGTTVQIDSTNGVKVGTIGKSNIASADIENASDTTTYTNTNLANAAYVDEKVATATSSQASQSGVTATITASTVKVPVYTVWNSTAASTIKDADATITGHAYVSGS